MSYRWLAIASRQARLNSILRMLVMLLRSPRPRGLRKSMRALHGTSPCTGDFSRQKIETSDIPPVSAVLRCGFLVIMAEATITRSYALAGRHVLPVSAVFLFAALVNAPFSAGVVLL